MSVSRSRVPPGIPGSFCSLILDLVVARLTKLASECQVHTHIWELVFLVLRVSQLDHVSVALGGFSWSLLFMGVMKVFYFVMSLDFLCCFILWPLSYQFSCFSEQVSPTPATDIHHHQTFINFHEQVFAPIGIQFGCSIILKLTIWNMWVSICRQARWCSINTVLLDGHNNYSWFSYNGLFPIRRQWNACLSWQIFVVSTEETIWNWHEFSHKNIKQ